MRTFMGVDLSLTATGYCIYTSAGLKLHTIKTEKKGGMRLSIICKSLISEIRDFKPDLISVESPSYGSPFGAIGMGEIQGAFKMALYEHTERLPIYVAPATLKKFATGSGRGEKSDVKMSVLEKWGARITDNNQADAYVLAKIAAAAFGAEPPKFQYEQEVLKTVRAGNAEALAQIIGGDHGGSSDVGEEGKKGKRAGAGQAA
jgi:crossover junction endodeoxyribonuclease RuvC